jgi:hypothetical protein
VVCTFLESAIINNDLGWRGFMFAQFVLLIWAADVVILLFPKFFVRRGIQPGFTIPLLPRTARAITVLLVIGGLTTAYDLAILRLFAPLGDQQIIPTLHDLSPDHQLGKRTYAARQAYAFIRDKTPWTAIIQHNPTVVNDRYSGLYGMRQAVVTDHTLYGVGVPEDLYAVMSAAIAALFVPDARGQYADPGQVCRAYSIDILVVKDTDPVWDDPRGWLAQVAPLYANDFFQIMPCASFGS